MSYRTSLSIRANAYIETEYAYLPIQVQDQTCLFVLRREPIGLFITDQTITCRNWIMVDV